MKLLREPLFSIVLIGICAILFLSASPLQAYENPSPETFEFKQKGFLLGGEVSGLVALKPAAGGTFGKLDLITGYQFNPYFSLNADLWTLWFLVYGAEINPKINLTKGKISPFITGSFGIGAFLILDEGDDNFASFITYSAGAGVDIHLSRKGTLYAVGKYRGVSESIDQLASGNLAKGLEIGVGFRWTF